MFMKLKHVYIDRPLFSPTKPERELKQEFTHFTFRGRRRQTKKESSWGDEIEMMIMMLQIIELLGERKKGKKVVMTKL